MKSEQKKRSSAYCRNAFVRLLFGAKRNMSRRITSAAFALLLNAIVSTVLFYINPPEDSCMFPSGETHRLLT